ncbi:MAG: hypothetical protein WBB46_11125 [Candidatus Deferrimicrobiaceae bacterium]
MTGSPVVTAAVPVTVAPVALVVPGVSAAARRPPGSTAMGVRAV